MRYRDRNHGWRAGDFRFRAPWFLVLAPAIWACGSKGDGGSDDAAGEGGTGAAVSGTGGRVLSWQSGGTSGAGSGSGAAGGGSGERPTTGRAGTGGHPEGGVGAGGSASGAGGGTADTPAGGHDGGDPAVGGETGSCTPVSMDAWEPPAYIPARTPEDACSEQEIRDYVGQCLLQGDCVDFAVGGPSATCGACLAPSAPHANAYGPILLTLPAPASVYSSNTAGCIELVGEPDCARKIQAADLCVRAACLDPCTPTETMDLDAYSACTSQAGTGECAEYQAATRCVSDPAHVTACSGTNFEAIVLAVGKVFCSAG